MKFCADFIETFRMYRKARCSLKTSATYAWLVAYHKCPF